MALSCWPAARAAAAGTPPSSTIHAQGPGPRRAGWSTSTLDTATLLPDGTVLIVGDGSAELYDPRTRIWTSTGSMIHGRGDGPAATMLPDGRVLVAGGGEDAIYAEFYDPRSGAWTATAAMIHSRGGPPTGTLLANGTVLVAGGTGNTGSDDPALMSAELYDPSTGTWTATADMNAARRFHTATLLPDGRVLLAGSAARDGATTAELYDPGSGT